MFSFDSKFDPSPAGNQKVEKPLKKTGDENIAETPQNDKPTSVQQHFIKLQ